jgi:nucleotide-binding universal stress UspA family protein
VTPLIESVLHPTDLAPESAPAFAHALAIALARRAKLTLLSVGAETGGDWQQFPRVRETLTRWRLLEPGSQQRDVFEKLGVSVRKIAVDAREPTEAILAYLRDQPADLVVLATEQREGLPRFLQGSVAQRVARLSRARALFVPKHGTGFIAVETGTLSLRRMLVPIAHETSAAPAVEGAAALARALGELPVAVTLLHVGDRFPACAPPRGSAWTWSRVLRHGDPVEQILATARELGVDAIVMTSDGRNDRPVRSPSDLTECPLSALNRPLFLPRRSVH